MVRLAFVPLAILLFFVLGSVASLVAQLDMGVIIGALRDVEVRFALKLSLSTVLCSLVLSLCISIPAAWALARTTFPGRKLLDLALDLPMVTPPLVVGMGLLLLLGHSGPVSSVFPAVAANLFSPLGVIIAQTYVASSILVRTAISAFMAVDRNYIDTAYNLGLTPLKTFVLVEIPLSWRPILGGCILAVARCLGEFGATLMLAGATRLKTETLPVAIFLNISTGDFRTAIACSVLLMALALVLLFVLHAVQRGRHNRQNAAEPTEGEHGA